MSIFISTTTSGYWVKVPHKPTNTDRCVQCSHPFGEHFQQYDQAQTGCNNRGKRTRETTKCACDGFAMRYREAMEWVSTVPTFYPIWTNPYHVGTVGDDVPSLPPLGTYSIDNNTNIEFTPVSSPVQFREGEIIKYKEEE